MRINSSFELHSKVITQRAGSFPVPKLAKFPFRAPLGLSASDDELRPEFSHYSNKDVGCLVTMACMITAGTVAQDTIQWQHEQAKAQEFRVRTTLCRGTDLMSVQQHKTSNLGRRPSRFNPVLASTDAHFSPHDTRWRDEQPPPFPPRMASVDDGD